MVAAVSTALNTKATPRTTATQNQNQTRRPLLPSDPDNALAPRRQKSREVSSRYLSTSSSSSSTAKRSASPLLSRPAAAAASVTPTTPSLTIKRSQSVERRRSATPRTNSSDLRTANGNGGVCGSELSNARKMLITSTRSLSVSFQGESFSLQVSKAKPAPSPINVRKCTPERRKATPTPARGADPAENSRPVVEQQRWPGRLRVTNSNSMTRSMEFTNDRSRLNSDSSNMNLEKLNRSDLHSVPPTASDSESVSSSSTSESGGNACGGGGQAQRGTRGLVVAARFWQETNSRHRRQTDPGSPVSKTAGLKGPATPKLVATKRLGTDGPISSPKGIVNCRGQISPVRSGAIRAVSPGKFGSPTSIVSPMRGISPSRARNNVGGGVVSSNLINTIGTPSILSFTADIRREKIGENRIVEVHLLRILYNRLLQWRFVNARVHAALSAQRLNAEKSLFDACITISKLRESVRAKQTEVQWLRQNLKLISILKGQMMYLEELELMDQEYSRSLSGAIEALQASTLRLPVVGGARADVHNVKDAICSAVDVMQAMASAICILLSKVGEVNSLVSELANVTRRERLMLDQCKDLLSAVMAMQVQECTLRTHILQLKYVP